MLTDFINLEAHSAPSTVILLHDCIPFDEASASRERTTDFYTGDVWKATMALKRFRPDLDMVMVPTMPSGLCMVRGLDRTSRTLERELPGMIDEYRDLGFDHYLAHQHEMPELVPNTVGDVQAWLDRSPASR